MSSLFWYFSRRIYYNIKSVCFIFTQIIEANFFQHCGSQPRQHCYPETKCHRTPDTQCVPVQKEKCEKVPVETTEFVEEKQCLPFQLDLSQLSNVQGDPCAGYHVPQVWTFSTSLDCTYRMDFSSLFRTNNCRVLQVIIMIPIPGLALHPTLVLLINNTP